MREYKQFYINGAWVEPTTANDFEVFDPATEEVCATISLGNETDVDKAVAAAKAAFETFSQTSIDERVALLERIVEIYKRRLGDVAEAIRLEMGAPIKLASTAQAFAGLGHIVEAAKVLKTYAFTEDLTLTSMLAAAQTAAAIARRCPGHHDFRWHRVDHVGGAGRVEKTELEAGGGGAGPRVRMQMRAARDGDATHISRHSTARWFGLRVIGSGSTWERLLLPTT